MIGPLILLRVRYPTMSAQSMAKVPHPIPLP